MTGPIPRPEALSSGITPKNFTSKKCFYKEDVRQLRKEEREERDALHFLAPLYLAIRIPPTGLYKPATLSRQWIMNPFRDELILYHNNPIIRTGRHDLRRKLFGRESSRGEGVGNSYLVFLSWFKCLLTIYTKKPIRKKAKFFFLLFL